MVQICEIKLCKFDNDSNDEFSLFFLKLPLPIISNSQNKNIKQAKFTCFADHYFVALVQIKQNVTGDLDVKWEFNPISLGYAISYACCALKQCTLLSFAAFNPGELNGYWPRLGKYM